MKISKILTDSGICKSFAEVRRVINSGGIKVDGVKISDVDFDVDFGSRKISIGKKREIEFIVGPPEAVKSESGNESDLATRGAQSLFHLTDDLSHSELIEFLAYLQKRENFHVSAALRRYRKSIGRRDDDEIIDKDSELRKKIEEDFVKHSGDFLQHIKRNG